MQANFRALACSCFFSIIGVCAVLVCFDLCRDNSALDIYCTMRQIARTPGKENKETMGCGCSINPNARAGSGGRPYPHKPVSDADFHLLRSYWAISQAKLAQVQAIILLNLPPCAPVDHVLFCQLCTPFRVTKSFSSQYWAGIEPYAGLKLGKLNPFGRRVLP